jgi:hypothetical protein
MTLEGLAILALALTFLSGGYWGMFHAEEHCRNARQLRRNLGLSDEYLEPDTVRFGGRIGFAIGMAVLAFGIISRFG